MQMIHIPAPLNMREFHQQVGLLMKRIHFKSDGFDPSPTVGLSNVINSLPLLSTIIISAGRSKGERQSLREIEQIDSQEIPLPLAGPTPGTGPPPGNVRFRLSKHHILVCWVETRLTRLRGQRTFSTLYRFFSLHFPSAAQRYLESVFHRWTSQKIVHKMGMKCSCLLLKEHLLLIGKSTFFIKILYLFVMYFCKPFK